MITAKDLCKDFKIQQRRQKVYGYIRDLFDRKYEIKKAVKNISFEIQPGEIVGYIGPNGAGKSTTIKMLSGILVPTSGYVQVNGIEPYHNRKENAKQIGVVFGQRTQLWWDIPVEDSLSLMRNMYQIPEHIYNENLKIFNEVLGLDKFIKTAVRQLSLGQRMRADLACAVLHNPKLLFLDEPTIGLDIVVKEDVREFIKEINRVRGTTVILTTHDMSDIEKLCSRVIIIDDGTIMYDGKLNNLLDRYGSKQIIRIVFMSDNIDIQALKDLPLLSVQADGNVVQISYDSSLVNSIKILDAIRSDIPILDFKITESNTNDIIREIYKNLMTMNH